MRHLWHGGRLAGHARLHRGHIGIDEDPDAGEQGDRFRV